MAELYPSELPSHVVTGSYTGDNDDSVLRMPVDIGKSMSRNKYTGMIDIYSWRILMTKDESAALLDWYHNTLNKVLTFYFVEPLSGTSKIYAFITQPVVQHVGVEQYNVTFNVRNVNEEQA